ncbi:hypothetical protein FOZ61_005799 [Perkinsus olseni]|uniref:Uncharacterized protein n=1 Tax=Perkinsus olseni TaxID=32597 RepID=A0A7J6MAZ1_PEROL|nr:hypothetical protein FOZ61_005799 [Perkinsus olseni]
MLVPRQTGCFTAVLHFFKGRKRQQPDAASEAPDTFSIFPTSLPPVGGPRSRGKEQARLAGLTLGKVERTRTCLAEDDTADDDDDLRSLSTEASASRSARSHSSSLSALSAVLEGDPTRSKKVTFQGVANVVEYDAGDQGEWQKNETVAGPAAVPDSCSKVAVCGRPGSAEASRDDCDERCVPEALEWCFISVVASPYVTPVVAIGMRSVAWGEDAEWSVTESQGSDGQFRPVRGLFQLVYKLLSSSSSTLALGEGLDLAAAVPLHQDVDHPSGKADDEDADGGRTLGEKCEEVGCPFHNAVLLYMYSLRHAASCRTWSPSIIIRPNSTPTCRAAIKSCILLVLRRLHIITANKEIAQGSLPSRSDVDKRPSLLRRERGSSSSRLAHHKDVAAFVVA